MPQPSHLKPEQQSEEAQLSRLLKRLRRERRARKEAESLLTDKSTELYETLSASQRLEKSLKLALWGSGDQLWEWDARTDMIELSDINDPDGAPVVTSYSLIDFFNIIHPDDWHLVMMEWNSHLFGNAPVFDAQFRIKSDTGWHWLRSRGKAVHRDKHNMAIAISGTSRNISEQQKERRNLELLVSAFDNSNEGFCLLSTNRQIIDSNQAFDRLFSLKPFHESGARIVNSKVIEHYLAEIIDRAEVEGEWQGEISLAPVESRQRHLPILLNVTAIKDSGKLSYFIIVATDITERKIAEEQLRKLANFDALTGIANRASFEKSLDHAIEHAARLNETLALLFVDLDRFKQINDSMGHSAGDSLLKELAGRLQNTIRQSDVVGRWGGDEFVVLLTALRQSEDAFSVANNIRKSVLRPINLEGIPVTVSASIGVAIYPDDATTKEEMLSHADAAMYQVKSHGRNGVDFFQQSMTSKTSEKLMLEIALRDAITQNALELYYQPKLSLTNDGEYENIEALVRWKHHELGYISPGEFIPIAEESGLILDVGRWVLKTACEQIKAWQNTEFGNVTIAVNVSAKQLAQGNFLKELENLLEATDIEPSKLEVELTESCLLSDMDQMLDKFHGLHNLGVNIAIDDFGTGYSCLAYLKDLPLHTLKIDRAFVSQIGLDEKGEAIVKTIIMLAKSLNLRTVAEGVETKAQESFLKAAGCDEAQGYYYSRPVPVTELKK